MCYRCACAGYSTFHIPQVIESWRIGSVHGFSVIKVPLGLLGGLLFVSYLHQQNGPIALLFQWHVSRNPYRVASVGLDSRWVAVGRSVMPSY